MVTLIYYSAVRPTQVNLVLIRISWKSCFISIVNSKGETHILYRGIRHRKLSGRENYGRKRCTSNRDNSSLERIVKQSSFKNLGEIHKEWTEAGVSASKATTHRCIQDVGYNCRIPRVKPLLNQRQRQKCLTQAKEKRERTCSVVQDPLFR